MDKPHVPTLHEGEFPPGEPWRTITNNTTVNTASPLLHPR